ncbi:MAG TPA: hypothetical protein VMX36_02420 [Sedimentisphaerales bacterium]|nr:hypothetical protein [Sedimentisphaerales bacterium]
MAINRPEEPKKTKPNKANFDLDDDLSERIPLDLDGRNRFADDPDTADTGVADVPAYLRIVDIGAYEYTR